MPDVPLTAGPLSAAGPFPLLCSGLSLLPEPVLAAASVPPVLPLRVARSIRPAPAIRRSWTNLRPCGETLPPRLTQKSGGAEGSVARFCLFCWGPGGRSRAGASYSRTGWRNRTECRHSSPGCHSLGQRKKYPCQGRPAPNARRNWRRPLRFQEPGWRPPPASPS